MGWVGGKRVLSLFWVPKIVQKTDEGENTFFQWNFGFSGAPTSIRDRFGTQNGSPETIFSCFFDKNDIFQFGSNVHTCFGTKWQKIVEARETGFFEKSSFYLEKTMIFKVRRLYQKDMLDYWFAFFVTRKRIQNSSKIVVFHTKKRSKTMAAYKMHEKCFRWRSPRPSFWP